MVMVMSDFAKKPPPPPPGSDAYVKVWMELS